MKTCKVGFGRTLERFQEMGLMMMGMAISTMCMAGILPMEMPIHQMTTVTGPTVRASSAR